MIDIVVPTWVKDAIFYQIFPDRFARSIDAAPLENLQKWGSAPTNNGFMGGDLYGISDKIEYLKELGINAIYLNPIFQSASNHRYHTHDYYKVDPLLGGKKALHKLLETAHNNGMKVILDGVFNHASRGFYQFNHILESESGSPYKNWFHIHNFPLNAYSRSSKPNYEAWWGIPQLPKFNTKNPQVRQFIFDVARFWIEFGIDGWRLDVPSEINDDSFWQEFRIIVKKANPQAYIVGEIWVDEVKENASRWLKGDQFDGIMNYGLTSACIAFFVGNLLDRSLVKGQNHEPEHEINAAEFSQKINTILDRYSKQIVYSQYNLLDSHDVARFLTIARNDRRILRLAYLFLFTYPGAPAIYYGSEIGIEGRRDPDCRRAMNWDRSTWDIETFEFFKKIIAIRKKYPCLRDGDYKSVFADPKTNVYAYMRSINKERIIIILNNSESVFPVEITIGDYVKDGTKLTCLLSGEDYIVKNYKIYGATIGAREGVILRSTL
ncbi:MAG: glycoside hydrolase family 13 protein [Nitrospirae bacterium]|nr:glycoside hydrolase family 13 protein [Nitrospirota bacterium]